MYLKEKEEKKTFKMQVGCNQKNKRLHWLNRNEKDTAQRINEKKRFLLEKINNIDNILVKITKGEKTQINKLDVYQILLEKIRKRDVNGYNK